MAKAELQLEIGVVRKKSLFHKHKIDISDTAYTRLKELNELLMERFRTTDISLSETAEIAIVGTLNEMQKEEEEKNG